MNAKKNRGKIRGSRHPKGLPKRAHKKLAEEGFNISKKKVSRNGRVGESYRGMNKRTQGRIRRVGHQGRRNARGGASRIAGAGAGYGTGGEERKGGREMRNRVQHSLALTVSSHVDGGPARWESAPRVWGRTWREGAGGGCGRGCHFPGGQIKPDNFCGF